jgi:hypothetical protein
VQVAKFVKSKIVKHKEWKLDSAAIGVAWLDDQVCNRFHFCSSFNICSLLGYKIKLLSFFLFRC